MQSKTIYLIRHAQAEHNVHEEYHIPDAPLTTHGKAQAESLLDSYPHLKQEQSRPQVILTSPLIRTIQTSLIGFEPILTDGQTTVIPLAELQENSAMPCDTGSDIAVVSQQFPELDFSQVPDAWNSKKGPWEDSQTALSARARKLRNMLAQRKEDRIALVTHGGFCSYLIGTYTRFNNAECRQFKLQETSDHQWNFVAATEKDKELLQRHVSQEAHEPAASLAETEMPRKS